MSRAQKILEAIVEGLPAIKQALGADWPAFSQKLQAQAKRFRAVTEPTAMDRAANQFLGLFIGDERVRNIIRPLIATPPSDRHRLQHEEPRETSELSTIANRFYLLARHPDEVAEGVSPEELAKKADSSTQAASKTDKGTAS